MSPEILFRRRSRLSVITAAAGALLGLAPGGAQAKEYRVYLLAGQSNMVGYGTSSELPEELNAPVEGVWIYAGDTQEAGEVPLGAGVWATLTPGFGVGHRSDGETNRLSDRFGCELTFGAEMQRLRPQGHIAIVKYARGGSAIAMEAGRANWDPDERTRINGVENINQYDHALKTIDNALKARDIDGDGEQDTLVPCGIVWMQGETDGGHRESAQAYSENLAELMDLLRAALRVDDLPVVIGRISDSGRKTSKGPVWAYGPVIQTMQKRYCEQDPDAVLVTSTEDYAYSDRAHYDSAGYIDMGIQFARAMHALETDQPWPPAEQDADED